MVKKTDQARAEKAKMRADLINQIEAARTQQGDKLVQAVAHLRGQLEMAQAKYLTVNGLMQALSTYNSVVFGDTDLMVGARPACKALALDLSMLAGELVSRLEDVDMFDLDDTLLAGVMDERFVESEDDLTTTDITYQLLVVNLLQNVGPVIDDLVTFREATTDGIAKLEEELAKLDDVPAGQLTLVSDEPDA